MKHPLLFIAALLVLGYSCKNNTDGRSTGKREGEDIINELLQGNNRFAGAAQIHPHEEQAYIQSLTSKGQHPKAIIISCSDSRVPPELIFDQGFGDLFVIRNAGNVLTGVDIGSVEYAVEHLQVPLIIVMGHEQCGALGAFIENKNQPDHIQDIMDSLAGEQEIQEVKTDSSHLAEALIKANAKHGIKQLPEQSSIIREMVLQHKLTLKAAYYNMQQGKVELLN